MTKRVSGNQPGRPRAFSEEQALDAAMHVFATKGYEAASLADLTAAMGINRVSMYATFGNKESLFVKAMARYTDVGARHVAQCLAAGTARQAFERLLHDNVTMFTDSNGDGVCFVTQGPLTHADASEETKQFVALKRSEIELALRDRLDQAVAEGELAPNVSTVDLARFYVVMIQGIALHAQHGGTREELLRVVDVAMAKWPNPSPL
jgi:AcrR family transcriptional regulator